MIWEVFAYLAAATVAGCLIAAVSGLVWGPGATRELSRRLENMENRLGDVDDRITSEVKKRAGEAGRAARKDARTDADVVADAHQTLADPYAAPSVASGRVRASGVFPIPGKRS